MRKLIVLKELLLSFALGTSILIYLVFLGTYEKVAIAFMSVLVYRFITKQKKIDWCHYRRIFTSIFLGMVVTYFVIGFLPIEESGDVQLNGLTNRENIAVLLVFDGESVTYDVALALRNYKEETKGMEEVTIPLKLYHYKKAYEDLRISRYQEKATLIQQKLGRLLSPQYDVYIAYAEAKPYYHEVMDQIILKENYDKVIVQPISIRESLEEIAKGNHKMMPYLIRSKTMVRHGDSLWNSEKIAKAVVERIIANDQEKAVGDIGIVLMAGSNIKTKQTWIGTKNMRRELLFMDRIKTLLIKQGIESRKIISLDVVSGEKTLEGAVQQLRVYGVGKIYLTSIHDFLDKIENQSYIHRFMGNVEDQQGINMEYIDGWGVENLVIEELENRIRLLNVQE
jgi:hypothetical protein